MTSFHHEIDQDHSVKSTSENNRQSHMILIAKSSKTHGLRGGLVLYLDPLQSTSAADSVLRKGLKVILKSPEHNQQKEMVIADISFGNKVLLYLEGVTKLEQAEALLPCEIWLDRQYFPPLPEEADEYYLADLISLPVFDQQSGEEVGQVKEFYHNGQQIVVCVSRPQDDDLELIFNQHFFPLVDLAQQRVEIRLPQFMD